MIATFIILLFANLWTVAFQVFPTGSLPVGVSSAITTTIGWIWVVNPVVDVPLVFSLFEIFLAVEAGILAVEFFFWVYSKIPIFGKK